METSNVVVLYDGPPTKQHQLQFLPGFNVPRNLRLDGCAQKQHPQEDAEMTLVQTENAEVYSGSPRSSKGDFRMAFQKCDQNPVLTSTILFNDEAERLVNQENPLYWTLSNSQIQQKSRVPNAPSIGAEFGKSGSLTLSLSKRLA